MSGRDYLRDRLPLLLSFGLALLFLLAVVHLGVAPLRLADAAYILLLAAVATAVILLVDYRRQRGFRQAVRQRLERAEEAFGMAPLQGGKTREQRALAELLSDTQRRALGALQAHERSAEQHRAFVDLWVHQMKTPLAVLELTAQQEEDTEAWRSVAEEAANLAQGLELMLTSARLERFELDLRPSRAGLAQVAREGVNALKESWLRHRIFPSVTAPDEPVLVETDPKWLAVVLRQLLTNAIKYSPPEGRVRLEVVRLPLGASLSVRDEGPGIPAHEVPRIFERFFTGTNGRITQASTGMGLYLAAEICRRLGHDLSVDTELGRGSTFTITLRPSGLYVTEP